MRRETENPLIAALGKRPSESEIVSLLTMKPKRIPELRQADRDIRIRRLKEKPIDSISPFPEILDFVDKAHAAIRRGYMSKRDLVEPPQRGLYKSGERAIDRNSEDVPEPEHLLALIGPTGMGKSTAGRRFEDSLPKFIDHGLSGDRKARLIQFPVIRLSTPPGTSPSALPAMCCRAIAEHHRNVFGEPLTRAAKSSNATDYVFELSRLSRAFAIGFFALDDVDRLMNASAFTDKSVKRRLIDNVLWLRRTAEVPFSFIGNYPSLDLLGADGRTIRRTAEGGLSYLEIPGSVKDQMFKTIVEAKWASMLLRRAGALTPAMRQTLFDLSGGLPGYLQTLLVESQIAALRDGKESLSVDLVQATFEYDCTTLHGPVAALMSRDESMLRLYPDIYDLRAFRLKALRAKRGSK